MIVPRRAGKTLAVLAYALTVTRRRRGGKAFYASHRRETAAALWRDDWSAWLEDSPLYPRHVHLRRSNGSEAITWRHNRSTFRLLPPNPNAIRSFAADVAFVDEAREFGADAGAELEAAAFPTQATGLGGQAWIVSNAGTTRFGLASEMARPGPRVDRRSGLADLLSSNLPRRTAPTPTIPRRWRPPTLGSGFTS